MVRIEEQMSKIASITIICANCKTEITITPDCETISYTMEEAKELIEENMIEITCHNCGMEMIAPKLRTTNVN